MASGLPWENYVEKAIACPKELPFHTKIILDGKTWECLDRGGAIVFDGAYYWIDQLTAYPKYAFGTIKQAIMVLPNP